MMKLKLTCNLHSVNGAELDEDDESLLDQIEAVVNDLLYDLDDWNAINIKVTYE